MNPIEPGRGRAILAVVALLLGAGAFGQEPLDRIVALEDQRVEDLTELIELTGHAEASIRARAARALGRLQAPGALPPLCALCKDSDGRVRTEAAFALGQLFNRAAAPTLETLISDPEPRVREAAVLGLGKTQDRNSTAAILSRGKDEDRNVRAAVPLAVATLGDQNATSTLCELFAVELDPQVRWRIAYALARLGDTRARDTLLAALDDGSLSLIRLWAALGLRPMAGETQVARKLLELRDDPDSRVVVSLLQVIARAPLAFEIADIEPLLTHESFHVRAQLATTAAVVGGAGAAALLETLSRDPSPTARADAIVAMSRLLDRFALPLLATAGHDDAWQIRVAAARGYSLITGEKADRALAYLSHDPDVRVRAAVIEAIGARPGEAHTGTLLEALEDEDISVRGTAVEALRGRKEASAVPALIAALERCTGRDDYELRESIVSVLGELGAQQALPALHRALEDAYVSVRSAAADAIVAITGEERPAFDTAAGSTDDPDAPPPPALLPPGAAPAVVIKTSRGDIIVDLFPDEAPHHVARFLQSVENHLYDGLLIHRVVSNFVIQGGDPLGHGWGDSGFSLRDEINPLPYLTGTVGMPKAGKDTGGCQFFITHCPQPRLDGRYTVFGTVRLGMDVVGAIEIGDRIETIRRIDGH